MNTNDNDGNNRKKPGRPPKLLELSDDMRKQLESAISKTNTATKLLEKNTLCNKDLLDAKGLLFDSIAKINLIRKPVSEDEEDVLEELHRFVDEFVVFSKGEMERIVDVFNAYEKWAAYPLSRIRFTVSFVKKYKSQVYESTQRVRGMEPARAFIGLRLKGVEDVEQ